MKALADCLIAFELRGLDGDAYEDQRTDEAEKVQLLMKRDADASLNSQTPIINQLSAHACEQLHDRRTFHWPVEFPEVFGNGGFDAFVGNPPFMGGSKITNAYGNQFRDHIVRHVGYGAKGKADLSAYFFLRGASLLRASGSFGLMATNSIGQGDNRIVGIEQLVTNGLTIIRAVPDRHWPGTAGVTVAEVWAYRGNWGGAYFVNDVTVGGISSFLSPVEEVASVPSRLLANFGIAFRGTEIKGLGFTLEHEEANNLIKSDPRYAEVLTPYIIGEDINSRPDQSPARMVINFREWPIEKAQEYPECFRIVTENVKPYRETITEQIHEADYWKFWDKRTESYERIKDLTRVIARSHVSNRHCLAFLPTGIIYSHTVLVLGFADFGAFSLLQSSVHEEWARVFCGAALRTDMRYSTKGGFETFPFPASLVSLISVGDSYYNWRQNIMATRTEGLTDTYNRFHDRGEQSADIARLRALHVEMDQAVAAAYGWSDLDLGHGFHVTKQGERYTLSESARRTVLDRLLALNHQRYADEVAKGLHEKVVKKGRSRSANKILGDKNTKNQPQLF